MAIKEAKEMTSEVMENPEVKAKRGRSSITQKSSANKEDTETILEQISSSVSEVAPSDIKEVKAERAEQKIPLDEEIPCLSMTFGGLTWVSPKTNAHYRWNDIGDVEYIPFGELIALNNTKREFLFKPLFIIQDSRVVEYFRLTNTYEQVAQIHQLPQIFKGDLSEISKAIDTAIRVNMRDVVISKVRDMRRDGSLNNIDVIRLLERKLGFDISEDERTE